MKLIIVFCLAAFACAQPQRSSGDVQIVENKNDYGLTNRDKYNWGFLTSDGGGHEQSAELKNRGTDEETFVVKGKYFWVGDDGVSYKVSYTADENGFQPEIEQGPGGAVPPGVVASLLG
ncbi:insect cuticle protein domain-containing protein [Phthorimaea operculella]|nr:insect cuticle protein domain-containing protein [Phthorimaea operculella]